MGGVVVKEVEKSNSSKSFGRSQIKQGEDVFKDRKQGYGNLHWVAIGVILTPCPVEIPGSNQSIGIGWINVVRADALVWRMIVNIADACVLSVKGCDVFDIFRSGIWIAFATSFRSRWSRRFERNLRVSARLVEKLNVEHVLPKWG